MGDAMGKGYSTDMRVRAIELVEEGESAREAARILGVGASSTIRWVDRFATTGSVTAKPATGHCHSPLEALKDWLLDLVAVEPDLTLEEIRARLIEVKQHKAGIGSIWRFYDRHKISFKKNSVRRRTGST
jgi:transposase